MRPNHQIDFFSSPTSKFIGFSDIGQPHHETHNHEQQIEQSRKQKRKSSFQIFYDPIYPIEPLGDDFFDQKLEQCDQSQYSPQDIIINDLKQESPLPIQKQIDLYKLLPSTTCKPTEHRLNQQNINTNLKLEDDNWNIKLQQNNGQGFKTPQKKSNTLGYKRLYETTSQKEKSLSRNNQKGLRRLSQLAFSIVSHSSATSYKEVAQKLLSHFNFDCNDIDEQQSKTEKSSMQNVKRRVYDSLNVLLALGVIKRVGNKITRHKQKKSAFLSNQYPEIQRYNQLLSQYQKRFINLQTKKRTQKQLKNKLEAFKKTIQRNKKTKSIVKNNKVINLPFLVFASKQFLQQGVKQANKNQKIHGTNQIIQKIEWLNKKDEKKVHSKQDKQKKTSVSKRGQSNLMQIQNNKDETIQIKFKSFPQSYGDLDFFQMLEHIQIPIKQQNENDLKIETIKIQNQEEYFKYPLQQFQNQKPAPEVNHIAINLIDQFFYNT